MFSKLKTRLKTRHYYALFGAVLILSSVLTSTSASAFTPNYNPSDLIDNGTLLNSSTMSAADIQSFLSNIGSGIAGYSDVEACDSTIAPYYTHCGQRISAAQIIYDASQAYGINPRVILATMEKEQSLVTDPSPSSSQINCAMGYNSCTNYVGFFTQIDNGTWVIRYNYEGASKDATWDSWYPGANYPCASAKANFYNNALYPGNTVTFADAGGLAETVTLSSAATASLYCYTPYVGPYNVTGYSGSYNFDYYYQLWFGSTQTSTPYAWQYQGQATYADPTRTQMITGATTVAPGGDVYAQVSARNIGYQTWTQSTMHLGTSQPNDRASQFYDSSWINQTRPAGMMQSSIAPGAVATFNFILHAPQQTGTYNEYFNLVDDGVTWLNDPGMFFSINVVAPVAASNTQNTGLASGQALDVGKYLLSPDTESTLNLQTNGDLVLYSDFNNMWSNAASDPKASVLNMQTDGNLVEYDSTGNAVWASGTAGNAGAYLSLQTDGNLVIYSSSGTALWNSGTGTVPNHLDRVDTTLNTGYIFPGQSMQTVTRNYKLQLQGDGNLVLYYNNNQAIWQSGTAGQNVAYLVLQGDGNLVMYNTSSKVIWTSATNGSGTSSLHMQPDGNLVLYNTSGQPVWNTNTSGVK
jgi:hypothetical protein